MRCQRRCSSPTQSFRGCHIRFARRPCAKPHSTARAVRGTGGISALSAQTAARPEPLIRPLGQSSRTRTSKGPDARAWVVVWSPLTPRLDAILGPAFLRTPGLQGPEFLRIFGACGAASRGGGGAPPTTLILLRNQIAETLRDPRPPRRRPGPFRGRSGPPARARPGPKSQCIFCRSCWQLWARGLSAGCVSIACGDVSHVRGPLPLPPDVPSG